MAPPPQTPTPVIPREAWEGFSTSNDGDRLAFFRLTPGATVKIGDKSCSRSSAAPSAPSSASAPPASSPAPPPPTRRLKGQVQDETRDNRSLVDSNTAQTLSSGDIETMRIRPTVFHVSWEGVSGDAIVEALIANSSTFGNKTVFSQVSIRRNTVAYVIVMLIQHHKFDSIHFQAICHNFLLQTEWHEIPSGRGASQKHLSICETYFKKYPARIRFMRVDALSLLLSMANVGAYSDMLAVDMVGGLVVGAVAERLGGTGYVCSTYLGSAPSSIDIIRMYNLSSDMTSRIFQASLADLCSLQSSGNAPSVLSGSTQGDVVEPVAVPAESFQSSQAKPVDTAVSDGNAQSTTAQPIDREAPETATDEHRNQGDISMSDCKGSNGNSIAPKAPRAEKAPSPERMKYWGEHGFSSLIVAAPGHEVESVVADLLPLLSYSAPFAIYHKYLQVLPSRTHAHMQMNAFGGYILSGIWIHKPDPE